VTVYIAPDKAQLLAAHRLDNFDAVWDYQGEWFEPPNQRRGGWSGVNRVALPEADAVDYAVFLKRQQNHQRRTGRHPIAGVPTFLREFSMLLYLQTQAVPAPKPVFFAKRKVNNDQQAILMTEALTNYLPLDQVMEQMFANGMPSQKTQRALIDTVAIMVRKLHVAGVQHRALYPKHIFVRLNANQPADVAVIDLEKSRITFWGFYRTYIDLAALNRHAVFWSRTKRLYFFKQYLGVKRLNRWHKFLCRLTYKRSQRGSTFA